MLGQIFKWFILAFLLLNIPLGHAADLSSDVERLEDIPAIAVSPEPQIIQFPVVAYGAGPEFSDPVKFDEEYGEKLISLKLTNEEVKFGYSNQYHAIFIHLAKTSPLIEQHSQSNPLTDNKLLTFNNYISGLIHVYRRRESDKNWTYIGVTGSAVTYHKRLVPGLALAIPLETDPHEGVYYFISRLSHHRFDGTARIISRERYHQEEETRIYGYIFYIGAIVSLFIFNLLIFISLRDSIYLFYSICAISVMGAGLSVTGMIDFIFADLYITPSQNLFVFTSFSIITSILFAARFYDIKKYSKTIAVLQNICIGLVFLSLLAYLGPWNSFLGGAHLGQIIDILLVLSVISMLLGAFVSLKRGNTMAKFYITSWIFMFGGALIYLAHFTGIIPRNSFSVNGVLWGNLVEMIIVSLGMAYKISILDREKKQALLLARGKKEYQRMVRVLLHDLSNPISLVSYYVGLKKNRPDEFDTKATRAWDKINFGLTKLSEIISFHREQEIQIDKLTRTVKLNPVLLREAIIEVELMFEEIIERKNLHLVLEGSLDVFVSAERVSLVNEVFNNIISNAIKFSPVGGKITIKVETDLDVCKVCILDEGEGFTDEQIAIFDSGEILDSTVGTIGEKGTGFGLSLARGYMKVYDGQISLKHRFSLQGERIRGTQVVLTFNRV